MKMNRQNLHHQDTKSTKFFQEKRAFNLVSLGDLGDLVFGNL